VYNSLGLRTLRLRKGPKPLPIAVLAKNPRKPTFNRLCRLAECLLLGESGRVSGVGDKNNDN
jgi:hypothetical protein